jgi:hypothetical protein
MPRFRLFTGSLVLGAYALVAGGCSRGETLYPVAGSVEVAGQPLTFGGVSFHPAADKGNTTRHQPTGRVDEQGHYQLSTGTSPGAPPGWYRVVVLANPALVPSMAPPKFATNLKYTREDTTDILLEVVAKPAPNAYDLHLTK